MKSLFLLMLFVFSHYILAQNIVLNEIMSSNSTTIEDEFGNASDWIELFNASDEVLSLEGYYISDDTSDIKKWRFSGISMDANSYLIVFASDMDTIAVNPHTNFKITSAGEHIILSDSSGVIIDSVFVPKSNTDESYGRRSDNSTEWIFQQPSPGLTNTGIEIPDSADQIFFSLPGGFYSSEISVQLSAGESDIFYTLDGSDPDTNSILYSNPITISETTVLKAFSKKVNHLNTGIIHQTYLMNENTDLPVISISTEPSNLFDPDSGIFINYNEDWERSAHIEFYDDDKNLGFSENVGINIYGGYSRRYAQKSLGVKFKSKYGNNRLDYELFPGFRLKSFKAFVLRNSGNDFEQTHLRDAFMQTLVEDLDIDYLEYRPAAAYINGEYWGIYNIREKNNEHYVAGRHDVDPDNIDMMEGYSAYNDDRNDPDGEYGLWVGNLEALHGDTLSYKTMIDYLHTEDLTTESAYAFIDSVIDIDECLLYYAAHVYFNSQDWPSNNSKYWRERSPEGKWRWILYDLDFGFNLYEWNNEGNSEDHVNYLFSGDPSQRPWSKPVESTFIPRKLVLNPKIKNQFVNQVADLLNTNFKSDKVLDILNNIKDHIAGDIGRHRSRFGLGGDYNSNINRMISFAQERPGYLRDHVRNFFNTGEDALITLNTEGGGSIELNSLTFSPEDLPWSGVYYQNNTIQLKAIANPGYKFDGWEGTVDSEDSSLEISGIRTISLTAVFSIDSSSAKEIVINEINYNSSESFDTGDWIELFNRSEQTIDLSNWFLSDSNVDRQFLFPDGTKLDSGEYLVLVNNDSSFSTLFPNVQNFVGEMDFGLSGSGEYIELVNEVGQIIDSLTYGDDLPWPVEADGTGATLELINPASDNSLAENWRASLTNGTPGLKNSHLTNINNSRIESIPDRLFLAQNYPNPFNPVTNIIYQLPSKGFVTLKVYDILGQEVKSLVNGIRSAGKHEVSFDGSDISSGIYYYQISFGSSTISKKFLLLK